MLKSTVFLFVLPVEGLLITYGKVSPLPFSPAHSPVERVSAVVYFNSLNIKSLTDRSIFIRHFPFA